MKPKRNSWSTLLCAASLAALPVASQAGTITFAEFDGLGDNAAIPSPPEGLPAGITAVWTGLVLHTTAGDTPMSVFPGDDLAGDDATIAFSAPVSIESINAYDTSWGSSVTLVGRLGSTEAWRYVSPGDAPWTKLTVGAGKAIDTLVFEGKWNHYDDIVVEAASLPDTDNDGLPDAWETQYFPGDLTKLTATGDYDKDGLTDVQEYGRKTNPTKADTDNDGLSDKVETGTGAYASPTDTGTDPLKADTDNDGRKDGDEVNGPITSDPFNVDSDGDTYEDGLEVASGHSPTDASDNPDVTAIAHSANQFSGFQGQDGWTDGYRNYTADGGGVNYNPSTGFIPFAGGDGVGEWDGTSQQWSGTQWDLNTAAAGPWTELGRENTHPNSGPPVHWTVRRWVASSLTQVTPLSLIWHTHKSNTGCGNGVTAGIYINGQAKDTLVVAAGDGAGVTHVFFANVAPNDFIDLILSPRGADGQDADGCDGSVNRLIVDTRLPESPIQPDGSIFIPVGAGDSDADGLPDVWEKSFFPNDLTKLTANGDYDKDGVKDTVEYARGSNPTLTDTDGDGLSDLVETGTGAYVSATDTGSNPTKTDTDGDGLNDAAEVNRAPPTNPNKADTDGDGFSDGNEVAIGSNPVVPMIANSQSEFSGVQGSNGWYNGYLVFDPAKTNYDFNVSQDFIPYPGGEGQGAWDGVGQTWTGSSWDLNTAGAAPWTYQSALEVHPNGTNSSTTIDGEADATKEHWTIRRWAATEFTKDTRVTIYWLVKKSNTSSDGTTGLLFVNGKLVDSRSLAGNDNIGEVRRYTTTLKRTDIVDLALTPLGANGRREDWSDASQTWMLVDIATEPVEIRISGAALDAAQGKCAFHWSSQPGAKYTVWRSSDLKVWTTLQTVDSAGATTSFTDTLGSPLPAARFYRVSQQ